MEYVAKYDKEGNLMFPSKMDELRHNKQVEFYKRTGTYFRFSLVEVTGHSTESQVKLFKRLVIMMSESSGDDYSSVYKDLHKHNGIEEMTSGLFGKMATRIKDVSELDKKEFERFINACVTTANEIFNMNLVLYSDETLGTVLRKAKEL